MKLTEPKLNTLIDNLNALICEDSLLLAQQSQRVTHYLALSAKITSFDQ